MVLVVKQDQTFHDVAPDAVGGSFIEDIVVNDLEILLEGDELVEGELVAVRGATASWGSVGPRPPPE